MNNILRAWRNPHEREIDEHYFDAQRDNDPARVSELECLKKAVELYAPRSPEEMHQVKQFESTKPNEQDIDRLF